MTSFESAIVPRWGASTICFRNVYVSRRANPPDEPVTKKKTSQATPPAPIPFLSSSLSPDTYIAPPAAENDNYTMFDVNLDEVEVELSFMRWLDGKGLVKTAKVKGVRGVVGESDMSPIRTVSDKQIGVQFGGILASHFRRRTTDTRPDQETLSLNRCL